MDIRFDPISCYSNSIGAIKNLKKKDKDQYLNILKMRNLHVSRRS